MFNCIGHVWRLLFRPKDRPEIARAFRAIDAKQATGDELGRALKRLAEKL